MMTELIEYIRKEKLTRETDVAGAGGFYDYAVHRLDASGLKDEPIKVHIAGLMMLAMWDVYENLTQFW